MIFYSKSKVKNHFKSLKAPYATHSINKIWKTIRDKEKCMFYKIIQNLKKEICLDLGSGSCEYSKILLDKGTKSITCVDFSDSLMSEIKDMRIKKVISDVEIFNTNEKYDLILCLGVLEFLDNPKKFIIHLRCFLKLQGRLIILLPKSNIWSFFYILYYFLKGIPIRLLSLKTINSFLLKEGFFLEKKMTQTLFSGLAVYSISEQKK